MNDIGIFDETEIASLSHDYHEWPPKIMKSSRLLISALLVLALANVRADQPTTNHPLRIVIVGDSTVCNYPEKSGQRGWGMFVDEHFQNGTVKVINLAVPGRSTKTFIEEGRWEKALEEKPDYVLIQFGHNDSHNPKSPEATDPAKDYKDYLRRYVHESRAISAKPILVTPVVRRSFDANGKIVEAQPLPSRPLRAYAEAMREIASEKNVPLIDLYASSKALVEQIGPEKCIKLAANPADITHFNADGAKMMADLVMKQLPTVAPGLKSYLKTDN